MIDLDFIDDGDHAVITVYQHLNAVDISDIKRFISEIFETKTKRVIVDMKRVEKLSMSGIGLVHTINNRVIEGDRSICFIFGSDAQTILKENSSLDTLWTASSLAEARQILEDDGMPKLEDAQ